MDGKQLDEISKLKEEAVRPYQNVLKAICGAAVALVICALAAAVTGMFG